MMSDRKRYNIDDWLYAWGKPSLRGVIREKPESFQVTEELKHKPAGDGEHAFLFIQKRNTNTDWVAGQLAKHCGVAKREVGYAGMKDRLAVTRQWFSVYLANKPEPNWVELNSDEIQVLITTRHQRKLRRGALNGNQFEIAITGMEGEIEGLIQRLNTIKDKGVPNYFGEQRFGKYGHNMDRALEMFSGKYVKRQQRGIYLSAARSYLFNEVLSHRIRENQWHQVMVGDVLMLSGTHSVFVAEADKLDELQQRLDCHDLDITGPLAGDGESMAAGEVAALEKNLLDQQPELLQGLIAARMEQARRPLNVVPQGMRWELSEDTLSLKFFLPAGSYATSVLREIVDYTT